MNFRSAIAAGIMGVVVVSVALAVFTSEQDDKDKIRLAFFPNVGHAVPIIGLEQEIFYEKLGNETIVEKKIYFNVNTNTFLKIEVFTICSEKNC